MSALRPQPDTLIQSPVVNRPARTIVSNTLFSPYPLRRPATRHTANNDRICIDFIKCLHQAKAIVRELKYLSRKICPSLRPTSSPDYYEEHNIRQLHQHLEQTFTKFSRLCAALFAILAGMEANPWISKERIHSFRADLNMEWKTATDIRREVTVYIRQCQHRDGYLEATTLPHNWTTSSHGGSTPRNSTSSGSSSNNSADEEAVTTTTTMADVPVSALLNRSSSSSSAHSPSSTPEPPSSSSS